MTTYGNKTYGNKYPNWHNCGGSKVQNTMAKHMSFFKTFPLPGIKNDGLFKKNDIHPISAILVENLFPHFFSYMFLKVPTFLHFGAEVNVAMFCDMLLMSLCSIAQEMHDNMCGLFALTVYTRSCLSNIKTGEMKIFLGGARMY